MDGRVEGKKKKKGGMLLRARQARESAVQTWLRHCRSRRTDVRRTARCRALCGSFSAGCNGAFTARWRVDFVPVEKPGKTRIDS